MRATRRRQPGNADQTIAILVARDDIRLVITDIGVPGLMDGLRLGAAVKYRWLPMKFIIATGTARRTWKP